MYGMMEGVWDDGRVYGMMGGCNYYVCVHTL